MLDEGGFSLPDGRRFTDPSVTENDVLEFLQTSGKQGRLGTAGLEQRLADEEAEYYARQTPEEAQPPQAQPRTVTVSDRQYTLTTEQAARWETEVDQKIEQANRKAADLERTQGRQAAESFRKGRMMEIAGVKREIVGALTGREQAARERQAQANVAGKQVSVGGRNATVVNTPFGKVRVQFEDGGEQVVEREKIGPPVVEPVSAPQPPQRRTPPAPTFRRRPGQRAGIPEPLSRPQRPSETGALTELGDFFGEMGQREAPETQSGKIVSNLSREVRRMLESKRGQGVVNYHGVREIPASEIGLENAAGDIAEPVKPELIEGYVHIDNIDIGTPEISPDRILLADKNLSEQGLRADVDDPITLSLRKSVPGRWAGVDGNSRIAALKLGGFKGYLPVRGLVEDGFNPTAADRFFWDLPAVRAHGRGSAANRHTSQPCHHRQADRGADRRR
jgi:hypothetical protein